MERNALERLPYVPQEIVFRIIVSTYFIGGVDFKVAHGSLRKLPPLLPYLTVHITGLLYG